MQALSSEQYDFSAKPKVVKPRSKYRELEQDEDQYPQQLQNMMFDKRVVRGNTYAAIVTSKNQDQFKDSTNLVRSMKRPKKQQKEIEVQQEYNEPGTPEPVQGRVHVLLQTDEYVETLTDKPPNYEKDTQTDFYLDRPLDRIFMPKKTGIDRETQIWDGDLFDFDYEVEPILQVLIGKTLEQSRMEVLEEEELRIMKEQQKRFEQLKNAEFAETQRMEAKERRLLEENMHRKAQYKAKTEQNILSHKKMISRLMAKSYLNKLQPTVIEILKDQGVFRHPLEMTLLHKFLPWVYQENWQKMGSKQTKKYTNKVYRKKLKEENKNQKLEEKNNWHEKQNQREKKKKKRKRLEMERRLNLRNQVLEQLVSKGDQRLNVLSLQIADIDFQSPEAPPIGLFGGLIGEVILFSSCLSQLGSEEGQYPGLKEWASQTENIVALFKDMLQLVCQEGGIEIQIDENVEKKFLEVFGAGGEAAEGEEEPQGGDVISLANWHLSPDDKLPDIYEILKTHIANLLLRTIKQNSEALSINEDAIDECIMALLKLIYQEDSIHQKVKWVKVAPVNTFDQVGIAYMKPDLNALQISSKSERYMEQQEPQNEDEEPKPVIAKNLAEADYENKQICFPNQNEEIKVMIQHPVAELILRDEIIKNLSAHVSSLLGAEFNILLETTDKMKEIQATVLDYIIPDFPVLDMDTY